ncbi:hypothetical protein ACLOJK_006458 [Asimina triloba]
MEAEEEGGVDGEAEEAGSPVTSRVKMDGMLLSLLLLAIAIGGGGGDAAGFKGEWTGRLTTADVMGDLDHSIECPSFIGLQETKQAVAAIVETVETLPLLAGGCRI